MREVDVQWPAEGGDTPEQRRSEEALRESQAAFHELIELAPDAVMVSDADRRITDVNTAACKLHGYSREELLGKTLADVAPEEEVARADREVPPIPGLVHRGEWRLKRSDGTLAMLEISTKVLPDGRTLSFARDITERKRAERDRDESLRWMRAVLEQSPVGLILAQDPRGEHLRPNARAQQMVSDQTERLEDLRHRVYTPDGQLVDLDKLPIARALRGERTVGAEFLLHSRAGTFTPVAIFAGPIAGPDGTVLGAVAAFEDITAVKELERLRAEWSSVVAHDLRQPLGSILLNAQLCARSTDDARLLKYAERILAAGNRLNRMVGDLMDLSRLEARRLELARQRVDVPALVRAAVERMELEAADRPFDVRVQDDVPDADADPDRIAQVMDNLLTNAVKYGTGGTPIVVSISREAGAIAVAVTNAGRAITAEELPRIFERFQRTASAKLEGIQGFGLGLYITRSLVEAHGGRITVECTPEGVTTFRFTLPVAST